MARKRKKRDNIDDILTDWPYDPRGISVRLTQGEDGRDVIQMRVDLGILQLETKGRPDGQRPQGSETFYDAMLAIALRDGDEFTLDEDQCGDADREFVQYYHRRICWLALREFERAVEDADHTLALMDFCRTHSPDEQWTISHEQYRPFVLFHRTQAAAMARLETQGGEGAIQEINDGLEKMKVLFEKYEAEDHFEDDELVQRLIETRESLREQHDIGKTLQEQLAEAVATEQYELAAQIRDELAKRRTNKR